MSLIQISHKRTIGNVSALQRFFGPIVVEKFFLLGVLCGLVGTPLLGGMLWLRRAGYLTGQTDYLLIRELHAFIQIYLFVCSFVLGFLIQAAPRLFRVEKFPPSFAVFALPLTVCSFFSILYSLVLAKIFQGLALCAALLAVCALLKDASRAVWFRSGALTVGGLLLLIHGLFGGFASAQSNLALLWGGVFSIVLATAQQFISGVLGGTHLSEKTAAAVVATFVICLLGLYSQPESLVLWRSALASGIFSVLLFAWGTNLKSAFVRPVSTFGVAMAAAFGWSVLALVRLWPGSHYSDAALHLLSMGACATLIFAVSQRMLSVMSESDSHSSIWMKCALVAWQIGVFLRGFEEFMGADLAAAGVVLLVFGYGSWMLVMIGPLYILAKRHWQILRGNLSA